MYSSNVSNPVVPNAGRYIPPHQRKEMNSTRPNEMKNFATHVSKWQAQRPSLHQAASPQKLETKQISRLKSPVKAAVNLPGTEEEKILGGRIRKAQSGIQLFNIAKFPQYIIEKAQISSAQVLPFSHSSASEADLLKSKSDNEDAVSKEVINDNRKEIFLNDKHWALLLRKFALLKNDYEHKKMAWTIVGCMREKLTSCTFGGAAQIVQSLGKMEINSEETQEWMLSHLLKNLPCPSIRHEEVFMLLCNAKEVFSSARLNTLIQRLDEVLFKGGNSQFFNEMEWNTLVSLGTCCQFSGNFKSKLNFKIWDKIKSGVEAIPLNEIFYYLSHAKKICFLKGGGEFLQELELRLSKEKISKEEVFHAWKAFGQQRYWSKNVEVQVAKLLESPHLADKWDKIALLYGYALLGDTSKRETFIDLLNDLQSTQKADRIHLFDKIKLLYIASIFLDSKDSAQNSAMGYLQLMLDSLESVRIGNGEKNNLMESANVLGLKTSLTCHEGECGTSATQDKMTFALQRFLKAHPILAPLRITSEHVILTGRQVDILIDGFEKLNWNQKPLVIEIDGLGHFRQDDDGLGVALANTVRRAKIIENEGYELWEIDLRNGMDAGLNEIYHKLQELIETHQSVSPSNLGLNESNLQITSPSDSADAAESFQSDAEIENIEASTKRSSMDCSDLFFKHVVPVPVKTGGVLHDVTQIKEFQG